MRLEKLQEALARLSIDAELRAQATDDPHGAASALGLTVEELREAASIAGLEGFASSLISKRLAKVRLLLPRTTAALGEVFDRSFRDYAAAHPVSGVKKHALDAVSFAATLKQVREPVWISDLSAYEAGWAEANMGRRLVVKTFRHRVTFESPLKGRCVALWLRIGRRVRHLVVLNPRIVR